MLHQKAAGCRLGDGLGIVRSDGVPDGTCHVVTRVLTIAIRDGAPFGLGGLTRKGARSEAVTESVAGHGWEGWLPVRMAFGRPTIRATEGSR